MAKMATDGFIMGEVIDIDDIPRSGERVYTESELRLRDKFVFEYLRDRNLYATGVRMGYTGQDAMDFAKTMLGESYVARKITELDEEGFGIAQTTEELAAGKGKNPDDSIRKRIINALMLEAFDRSPGTKAQTRVVALNKLAEIYKVGQTEDSGVRSNVMVVPAMGGVDSWEQLAESQQEKLKAQVTH